MTQTVLAKPGECVTPKLMDCVRYLHPQIYQSTTSSQEDLPRSSADKDSWQQQGCSNRALVKESNGLAVEQDCWAQAKDKGLGKSWEL